MSGVSVADFQRVDDQELAAALDRAEATCVNGLSDRQAVAAECSLTPKRVAQRLNDLADRGHVAIYESLRMDVAGARSSYELLTEPAAIDPDAKTVQSPQFSQQYDAADCRWALARALDVADQQYLTYGEFQAVARESDPNPPVIIDRLNCSWEDAVAAAREREL